MEASTSAPMAIAIPPSDMMLAVIPIMRNGMKASSTAIGMVMMGMIALGKCHRNTMTISETVRITSTTVDFRVAIALQDQIRAVVNRDDLHAVRQAGLDLPDLRLHTLDHVQRILPLPHHDDSGDHVAPAVEVGNPPADVRPQHHLADVLDPDRRTVVAGREDDVLDVADGLGIAAPAHHVLAAAELDHAPAGFAVACRGQPPPPG